ncbi:hypothetical protein PI95_017020 [Hassallia byssoidea VB512170]|uniref:Uncharacterized protein n=1 Tax=Hassallia byssoidea VB512170 TaxID=1304833 RepID=A0A846HA52_9CYAN|nr:hypothetical protein [Hassalia byssoidea]NEU74216.1 hypothetical protein [Hassalia byssoidea VB512170]
MTSMQRDRASTIAVFKVYTKSVEPQVFVAKPKLSVPCGRRVKNTDR